MSLVSSSILIAAVLIMYYALIKIFSVLFRITGLPREKAAFQAVSLLTNAGYTTGESEIIVSEKTRRHIATAAMLSGYFFSVVIVSLFINLFFSIDFTVFDRQDAMILIGFGGLFLFFLILRLPFISRPLDKALDSITLTIFKSATKDNYISVLDTYGEDAVANIYLYKVPAFLEGKCIIDTDIRKKFNLNILMYTRNGQTRYVTKDTMFSEKDTLLAFGPLASIKEAFLLKGYGEKQLEHAEAKETNEITLMSNYGYQIMAEITVNKVPAVLDGKSLIESRIKDYFSINIMMVSRNGNPVNLNKDTVIEKGDKVIAFGPYDGIHAVFGEKSGQ